MSSCLNISKEELKGYTANNITFHEVTRDYLEHGVLRSPMAIRYKLDVRENTINDTYYDSESSVSDFKSEAVEFDNKTAEEWLFQLSNSLNVDAKVITRENAKEIHAAKGKKYSNENAFFVDGIVYFVEGTLTPESVVHEFSHPVIKSLDPSLKESLYQSILSNPLMQDVIDDVRNLYTTDQSSSFKEEVIVRALTKLVGVTEDTPALKSLLDKILYQIKQALRKLLGKTVDVKNLNLNTTLKEFAEMLSKGSVLELQKDLITSADIIEYFKVEQDVLDKFDTLNNSKNEKDYTVVQNMIDKIFDATTTMKRDILKKVIDQPEFFTFKEALINEYNTGIIDSIRSKLDVDSNTNVVHELTGRDDNGDFTNSLKSIQDRTKNLAFTLYKVEELFTVMNKEVMSMDTLDSKDKVDRIIYIKKFVDSYVDIIDTLNRLSLNESKDNKIVELANDLTNGMRILNDNITKVQTESVQDIFYELLKDSAAHALKEFNDEMEMTSIFGQSMLNAPKEVRDSKFLAFHNMTEDEYKRYKQLKGAKVVLKNSEYKDLHDKWLRGNEFDKETASVVLNGASKDANFWNGMLESMSLNADPAIASVYQHIQSMTIKAEAESFGFFSNFIDVIMPHVKATNVSIQKRGDVGKTLGHKNIVGVVKNGKVEREEEWQLLDKWTGNQYDEAVLEQDIVIAAEQFRITKSDADKNAWKDAKRALRLWKIEYMNQDYDAGWYEATDILDKDEIGRDAQDRQEEIQKELNELYDNNEGGKYDNEIKLTKLRLMKLSLTHDELGVKKTGRDLEVAERLKEYQVARSKFFVEDEIPNAFQNAYDDFSALTEIKYDIDSPEYADEMDKWLRNNTRVALKNSLHDKRSKLFEEKAQLLEALSEENKKIFDDTELQLLINEQTKIVKDNSGQPDGRVASAESREKVLIAHEEIELKRQDVITKTGSTVAEDKRYRELNALYKEDGGRWLDTNDKEEFDAIIAKRLYNTTRLGITGAVQARIQEIDTITSEMTSNVVTDHYLITVVDMLNTADLRELLIKYVNSKGDIEISSISEVENGDIAGFFNSPEGEEAMNQNDDLNEFVKQNHYIKNDALTPTKLWLTDVSNDAFDNKTKKLYDKNKNSLGLIKLDDTYRIPTAEYFIRVAKDQYVTKEVVGETKDNKGNWLPKSESSNRYVNTEYAKMKKERPEEFAFLQDLKKQYLLGQENAQPNDRLYLSFPRTQKTRLENIITGNVFKWSRNIKDWWQGREDDLLDYKITKDKLQKSSRTSGLHSLAITDVSMPVIGVSQGTADRRMKIGDISTDLLKTIPEYIGSVNAKKAASDSNSYARLMQDLVSDTDIEKVDKNGMKQLIKKSYHSNISNRSSKEETLGEKGGNRKKILDALIDRDIQGIQLTGRFSKRRAVHKLMDGLVKRSSKINFNWNLTSGIVNYGQIKVTTLTHIGQEMTVGEYLKGEAYAFATASEVSYNVHKRGQKGLNEQLFTIFDAISGRAIDTMGDTLSRTLVGDLLDGKLPQRARHWMELQGTLQNFGGMMYNKKVEITDKNGNTKKISYIDAFELVNNRIQTKEGVDPMYAITWDSENKPILGKGMIQQRLHMQNVIMKWNGAFAKKDQALAARYVYWKQLLFLKKHVIPLASKQISFSTGMTKRSLLPAIGKRMNWTTGVAEWGHTIGTLSIIKNFAQTYGKSIMYFNKKELKDLVYTILNLTMGYLILPALYRLVTPFGKDDDDEEKRDVRAMNDRAGYLDYGVLTARQKTYGVDNIKDYNWGGYALNTLSMITAKLKDEYSTSMFGLHSDSWIDFGKNGTSQSISMTQTFHYFRTMIDLMDGTKDTEAKKSSGPYIWQQKDFEYGNVIKLLMDYNSMNGKMLDPTGAQTKYEAGKRM
mgnify:CR=1 FL=1|tara:strand:- start:2131 stop:7773 length:5643 start_codon:yes stop_codon:yes gene_type:complete